MIFEVNGKDGAVLSAYVDGPDGRPAWLLMNSIGTGHRMWSAQISAFSKHFRVVALGARGHGASAAPDGDYMIDMLGNGAIQVLDRLDIGAAHVCGLSMGGAMAQWLAIHAPDRVAKLVLANTAARIGTADTWRTRERSASQDGLPLIADAALARFFSEGVRAAHLETELLFRARLVGMSLQGYAGCCAALRDTDFRPMLGHITAPTMVIAGTFDVSTPPAEAELLARAIPRAELVMLPAAHLSSIEQPDRVIAAISAFLERH